MYRLLAFAGFALAFLSEPSSALACSCHGPYDPSRDWQWSEVILDGVVIERDPLGEGVGEDTLRSAKMRVDQVWKGENASTVTVVFGDGFTSCDRTPPLDQKIRIASSYGPSRSEVFYMECDELPLDDPKLDNELVQYKARTEEFQRRAETQGPAFQFEFAQYLESNREHSRAMDIYLALLDNDPEDFDVLLAAAVLHAKEHDSDLAKEKIEAAHGAAPNTVEGHGKIARAEFEALGVMDETWNDYSEVKVVYKCHVESLDLSGVVFDKASLGSCRFDGAMLRNASFLGAHIDNHAFEEADVTGARFDCATVFWRAPGPPDPVGDFDPLAAGMINVEGSCPERP